MKRGITFEIPNEHGRILGEILKPLDVAAFHLRHFCRSQGLSEG